MTSCWFLFTSSFMSMYFCVFARIQMPIARGNMTCNQGKQERHGGAYPKRIFIHMFSAVNLPILFECHEML